MTPAELKNSFRIMMRDEVAPYLWSDFDIYQYMDRAQKDLCRATGGISDTRSDVTFLRMRTDVAYYPLSPKILKVVSVYRDDDGSPVKLTNEENMPTSGRTLRDSSGKVDSMVIGMDQDYVRLDPPPSADEDQKYLRFHVYRLPLGDITLDYQSPLEVHEQHHTHLMNGMAAQAHRKQDAETFDRERSNSFAQEFAAYCDQCKRERERREHKPRAVQYGGL